MNINEREDVLKVHNVQYPIVYLLLDKDEVVYVGQSKVGLSRPYSHRDKMFTDIAFIKCNEDELDDKETELIKKYKPKYNKKAGNSDYSITRTKNIIREQTNIHDFNLCDLKKLIKKFDVNTFEFENVLYIDKTSFNKIFDFVKETSTGITNKNVWKRKIYGRC